jgi:hypothetical protein
MCGTPPCWLKCFSCQKRPVSFSLNSLDADEDDAVTKEVELGEQNTSKTYITFTFDYEFDDYPQEISLYFTTTFESKLPFVSILWVTPDGREIRVADSSVEKTQTYRLSQDDKLKRRLGGQPPMQGLFADPASDPEAPVPLKGTYQSRIRISMQSSSCMDRFMAWLELITSAVI